MKQHHYNYYNNFTYNFGYFVTREIGYDIFGLCSVGIWSIEAGAYVLDAHPIFVASVLYVQN